MVLKIDEFMTLEAQIWNEIAYRKHYFTAKNIAVKISVSAGYVRELCEAYHKRGILDKKVKDRTNYYRIKP